MLEFLFCPQHGLVTNAIYFLFSGDPSASLFVLTMQHYCGIVVGAFQKEGRD